MQGGHEKYIYNKTGQERYIYMQQNILPLLD
jgi:hypothetical protein